MKYRAYVQDFSAVIGRNPELAERGNPNGDIVGTKYIVMLEREDGKRLAGPEVEEREAAEKRAAAIQRSLDRNWNPENAFREVPPAYGSIRYIEVDYEVNDAIYERNNDA